MYSDIGSSIIERHYKLVNELGVKRSGDHDPKPAHAKMGDYMVPVSQNEQSGEIINTNPSQTGHTTLPLPERTQNHSLDKRSLYVFLEACYLEIANKCTLKLIVSPKQRI